MPTVDLLIRKDTLAIITYKDQGWAWSEKELDGPLFKVVPFDVPQAWYDLYLNPETATETLPISDGKKTGDWVVNKIPNPTNISQAK